MFYCIIASQMSGRSYYQEFGIYIISLVVRQRLRSPRNVRGGGNFMRVVVNETSRHEKTEACETRDAPAPPKSPRTKGKAAVGGGMGCADDPARPARNPNSKTHQNHTHAAPTFHSLTNNSNTLL